MNELLLYLASLAIYLAAIPVVFGIVFGVPLGLLHLSLAARRRVGRQLVVARLHREIDATAYWTVRQMVEIAAEGLPHA